MGGGVLSDWYLSISLALYLLYPLLFKLHRFILVLIITIVVLLVQIVFNDNAILNVQQLCGIARIPMFCWGICLFKNKDFKGKETFIWYLLFVAVTLVSIFFRLHLYWILDTIAPFFLLFLYWFCKCVINNNGWIRKGLAFLGKYTLEIYVGNLISLYIVQAFFPNPLPRLIVYTLGTLVLSWILVRVNSIVQAAFKHMNSYV